MHEMLKETGDLKKKKQKQKNTRLNVPSYQVKYMINQS